MSRCCRSYDPKRSQRLRGPGWSVRCPPLRDPNENVTSVAFDLLGLLVAVGFGSAGDSLVA